MRTPFLCILFNLCGVLSYAQTYPLTISVKDEYNLSVPGAEVSLAETGESAIEISFGEYKFDKLPPATYHIKVYLQGYHSTNQKIDLNRDNTRITIKVTSQPVALDKVVIEGNTAQKRKRESMLNLEIVNEGFIQRNLGGSLMQSLKKLPGIETIDIGSGQSKPMIRGMGFNRISVIDKGIKHEAQQWGSDHGLEIDQFGIGEIEIKKGAASFEYGSDAIAGAINILPAAPPKRHSFGGDVNLVGQSNNALYGGSLNLYGRTTNWFATGRITYEDYGDYQIPADKIYMYSYPLKFYHHRVRNTAGRELDAHFSTGYFGENFNSTFYIDNTFAKSGFFANAHGLEPRGVNTEMHDKSSRDILKPNQSVNHFKIINRSKFFLVDHNLQLELGYQNNHRKEHSDFVSHGHMPAIYPDTIRIPYDLEREFNKNVFSFNLKDKLLLDNHKIRYGLTGEIQDNKISGWSFLIPAYNQQTFGGFISEQWKATEKLDVHVALRYDYSQIHIFPYSDWFSSPLDDGSGEAMFVQRSNDSKRNFNSVTGGIGLNYSIKNGYLKLNLGKSFRVPIAKELGANGVNYHYFSYERGNPNLNPEESYQIDFITEYEFKNWKVEVNPFYNYFPNYIYLNPTSDHDYLYGAGNQIYEYQQSRVQRYGGEFKANYHILSNLQIEVSAEYLYAKQLSGEKKGYTLPFSPPPSALLNLTYEPQKLGPFTENYFSGDFKVAARQNRIVPPEHKTAGYGIFDLQMGGKFLIGKHQKAELSIQVTNLFNTSYMVHTSFYRLIGMPERGRNIIAAIKIPFNFLTPK